jgi:hypothetical protein
MRDTKGMQCNKAGCAEIDSESNSWYVNKDASIEATTRAKCITAADEGHFRGHRILHDYQPVTLPAL